MKSLDNASDETLDDVIAALEDSVAILEGEAKNTEIGETAIDLIPAGMKD